MAWCYGKKDMSARRTSYTSFWQCHSYRSQGWEEQAGNNKYWNRFGIPETSRAQEWQKTGRKRQIRKRVHITESYGEGGENKKFSLQRKKPSYVWTESYEPMIKRDGQWNRLKLGKNPLKRFIILEIQTLMNLWQPLESRLACLACMSKSVRRRAATLAQPATHPPSRPPGQPSSFLPLPRALNTESRGCFFNLH